MINCILFRSIFFLVSITLLSHSTQAVIHAEYSSIHPEGVQSYQAHDVRNDREQWMSVRESDLGRRSESILEPQTLTRNVVSQKTNRQHSTPIYHATPTFEDRTGRDVSHTAAKASIIGPQMKVVQKTASTQSFRTTPQFSTSKEFRQEQKLTQSQISTISSGTETLNKGDGPDLDSEETNVQGATKKLVRWLQNRLLKRMSEASELNKTMNNVKHFVKNLEEEVETTSNERQKQIRFKLDNQHKLREFRRHAHEPDEEIETIERETEILSKQLYKLQSAHEKMTELHSKLIKQVQDSGLSHWLDVRGKDYLPNAAVGVLSRSVNTLAPVTQGLERAVQFDKKLSAGFENVVPKLSRNTLLFSTLNDMIMLLPFLPICFLGMQLPFVTKIISTQETVLYSSLCLLVASIVLLFVSLPLGHSPLAYIHIISPLVGTVFLGVTTGIAIITAVGQLRIAMKYPVLGEGALAVLAVFASYPFGICFERRSAAGMPITAHIAHISAYALLALERKRALKLHTPWDKTVDVALILARSWAIETIRAMKNVFRDDDKLNDISGSKTGSLSCLSTMSSLPMITDPSSTTQISTDSLTQKHFSRRSHIPVRKSSPTTELAGVAGGYARWLNVTNTNQTTIQTHGRRWYARNTMRNEWKSNPRGINSEFTSDGSGAYMSCRGG